MGLGSTIRDVFSEICSNIAYVNSGNGDHWDIGLVFESMNNFKTKSDTKLITLSCKFLIWGYVNLTMQMQLFLQLLMSRRSCGCNFQVYVCLQTNPINIHI